MTDSKSEDAAIREAEAFLKLWDGNLVELDEKAGKLEFSVDGSFFRKGRNLADSFGFAVTDYRRLRNDVYPFADDRPDQIKHWEELRQMRQSSAANVLMIWKDKAQAHHMLKPGTGALARITALQEQVELCEKKRDELQSDNYTLQVSLQKVMQEYKVLEGRYQELEKRLELMFKHKIDPTEPSDSTVWDNESEKKDD